MTAYNYDVALAEEMKAESRKMKTSVAKLSGKAKARAEERAEARRPKSAKKAAMVKGPTKRERAATVFDNMNGDPRKSVIKAMMKDADLSPAGAATYYQNFNSGKWEY